MIRHTNSLGTMGLVALLLPGCGLFTSSSDAAGDCTPPRELLATRAWPEAFGKVCIKCHSPDGIASEQNAALKLLPASYPGFLDAKGANLSYLARLECDGRSLLLRKPLGELNHGGGKVIERDSQTFAAIEAFVARVKSSDECSSSSSSLAEGVTQLSARNTFRKAALLLAGRLPTSVEQKALEGGDKAELERRVAGLTREAGFYELLKTSFNDVLLTDRYLSYVGHAVNLLNEEDFPSVGAAYDALADDERERINTDLAREALELIAHVAREGRPFTEILTASYLMVNPDSAMLLGVSPKFTNPKGAGEFAEAPIKTAKGVAWPHSGILTSPMWLNRFPTTPTNRNRGRARAVLSTFLATDILKIADRPVDPIAASAGFANPTRDSPYRNFCHRELDPIAGAFQKYDDYDPERYVPDKEWHKDMFAPGFAGEALPTRTRSRGGSRLRRA